MAAWNHCDLTADSAILRGASRVYIIDSVQQRLDLTASIGAIPTNFNMDPVSQILALEPMSAWTGVESIGNGTTCSNSTKDASLTLRQLVNVTARWYRHRLIPVVCSTGP